MISLRAALLLMVGIVVASNYLVQIPLNDWLTFGAITYPISYLITELTNRSHGPQKARSVVYAGFAVAALLSFWLATPKIAIASSLAFLISQLLDIYVFNKLRRGAWWYAPLAASMLASTLDSAIFWSIAFYGENMPVVTLAAGDTLIKFGIDFLMLTPFRLVTTAKLSS